MKAENMHDEIAWAAYELYENSGCIECRDLANWLEAERIILARHASQEKVGPAMTEDIGVKKSIIAPKRSRRVTGPAEKTYQ
jgi:hypothetical protein